MVSILPLISNSSSLFSKPLGTVPSAPTANGITIILIFHSFFCSLAKSKYLSIFYFLLFSFFDLPEWQNSLDSKFCFCCNLTLDLVFWPGLGDLCVSQKSKNFMHPILKDKFWFMHIPFGSMVKFKPFALSPPSNALSWTPFVLICYICLYCVSLFQLFLHIKPALTGGFFTWVWMTKSLFRFLGLF